MKEKAIHVIWPGIKALKGIVECGEVPGTQRSDEYAHNKTQLIGEETG